MTAPETIDSTPQPKPKMHWAPWLITGFFVLLLMSMLSFILVASRGLPDSLAAWLLPNQDQRLHTALPGAIVHDQNYLYESHMQKVAGQQSLGWKVEVAGLDHLNSQQQGVITVRVQDRQGQGLPADRVEVSSMRVANSQDDHHLELKAQGPGVFTGEIRFPAPGRWLIGVTVTHGADTYTLQRSLNIDAKN